MAVTAAVPETAVVNIIVFKLNMSSAVTFTEPFCISEFVTAAIVEPE